MKFNKGLFTAYLKEQNYSNPTKKAEIQIFQQFLSQPKHEKAMRSKDIFEATEEEIRPFITITDRNTAIYVAKLEGLLGYQDKSLYQITAMALADDKCVQQLALGALENRANINHDIYAAYNLIMLKYQLMTEFTAYQAKQELRALEKRFGFGSQGLIHAKKKVRFMAMLHRGHEYITNQTSNLKTLPLFETSEGEKLPSKVVQTIFAILAIFSLALAVTAGLILGGYILVLPAFLSWIAPIALTLLIGFSIAAGISIIAVLSETIKPKSSKHFFKGLGRTVKNIIIGLSTYLSAAGNKAAILLGINPFFKPDNLVKNDDQITDLLYTNNPIFKVGQGSSLKLVNAGYWSNLKKDKLKTAIKTLCYPFAYLLGSIIALAISPIIIPVLAYKLINLAYRLLSSHPDFTKYIKEAKDANDTREAKDAKGAEDAKDTKDAEGANDTKDTKGAEDTKDTKDAEGANDTKDTNDIREAKVKRYILFLKNHETAVKRAVVITSLLTWPLAFVSLVWYLGKEVNMKSQEKYRERLFDEPSKPEQYLVISDYSAIKYLYSNLKQNKLSHSEPLKQRIRSNSRLAALQVLEGDIAPTSNKQEVALKQLDAVQTAINSKNPTVSDGTLRYTRFIQFAYTSFSQGIFKKPDTWPTVEEFKGQPYAHLPPTQ